MRLERKLPWINRYYIPESHPIPMMCVTVKQEIKLPWININCYIPERCLILVITVTRKQKRKLPWLDICCYISERCRMLLHIFFCMFPHMCSQDNLIYCFLLAIVTRIWNLSGMYYSIFLHGKLFFLFHSCICKLKFLMVMRKRCSFVRDGQS